MDSAERAYARLSEGIVGEFWPEGQDGERPIAGHLQLLPAGQVKLTLFERESGLELEPYKAVNSFVGMTEIGQVIIPDVRSGPATVGFHHGSFFMVARIQGSEVVLGAPTGVQSEDVASCSYIFDGLDRWTGAQTVSVDYLRDPDDADHRFTVALRTPPALSAQFHAGSVALYSSGWALPEGSRFSTSQRDTFAIEPSRPAKLAELLRYIHPVQELISLAYRRPMIPTSAEVGFDLESPRIHQATIWDRGGFYRGPGHETGDSDPWFNLLDIGGIQALAEWIDLSTRHWRATVPLTIRHRVSGGVLENRFIDTCMGIEYWVRNGLSSAEPGQRQEDSCDRRKSERFIPTLIASIGSEAEDWIGDPSRYGKVVWDLYNDLKHGRIYHVDSMYTLTESAQVLLLCSLLKTSIPSSDGVIPKLLGDPKCAELAKRLRDRG